MDSQILGNEDVRRKLVCFPFNLQLWTGDTEFAWREIVDLIANVGTV